MGYCIKLDRNTVHVFYFLNINIFITQLTINGISRPVSSRISNMLWHFTCFRICYDYLSLYSVTSGHQFDNLQRMPRCAVEAPINIPFSKMAAENSNRSILKTYTSTRKNILALVSMPSFSFSGVISTFV